MLEPEPDANQRIPNEVAKEVDFMDFSRHREGSHYGDVTASVGSGRDSLTSPTSSEAERLPKTTILGIRVSFLNVLLMGFGFMFNIGAYATAGTAQTVVLNSVNDEYFHGTPTLGYLLWAINCGGQAFGYLFGPSVVAITGPKSAMVGGALCVTLYLACFIRPLTITLYLGSVLLGFGVGIIWVVQQHFITINSTSKRVMRNTGVFWGLYQSSMVMGNMFYFIMVHGNEHIEDRTRIVVFGVLTAVSAFGMFVFALVVHPWTGKIARPPLEYAALVATGANPSPHRSAGEALRVEGAFLSNVYGTALGYTLQYGTLRQSLVGLTGVFGGVGEILGGLLLSLFGKWMHYNGKEGMLVFGMIAHVAAFYLVFLNAPAVSSLHKTDDFSYIGPDPYVAMLVAFLLGLGDAIWNSQCMAYLGHVYRHDCVSVFGIYQFWGALMNAAAFLYATVLTLPYQLLILVINAVIATAGFCYVEWRAFKLYPPE